MAKIKLNKLPDGFEIKDGKVVKKMQQGGMMTGDQSNYALVTSPYNFGNDQFNNSDDVSVRYSLSSVPREAANIEAEGGETVLTDLNNDGQFGLYDIKGPRHSKGGVPMYLPEQSFVFSDTPKMKFNRQEMADFGIESRKKMTPAKISKKFQLNEYIGAMADPFADEITIRSAEMMRDKNQMSLSKLAFGQEAKKQFSDGVPVTAHPYLISQGINPIEFTQKVENITREQAAQRMFEGLSPEQQAQVMALRQMMEQAGQMQQPMQQQMAKQGIELPKAQYGPPSLFTALNNSRSPFSSPSTMINGLNLPPYEDADGDGVMNSLDQFPLNPALGGFTRMSTASNQNSGNNNSGSRGSNGNNNGGSSNSSDKRNISINPDAISRFQDLGITLDITSAPETRYRDRQRSNPNAPHMHGDAESNYDQWVSIWKPLYGEEKWNELEASLSQYGAGERNPKLAEFQAWVNETHIPQRVKEINEARKEAGYEPLTEQQAKDLTQDYINNFGFPDTQAGSGVDGLLGTFTTSRLDPGYKIEPKPPTKTPPEEPPVDAPPPVTPYVAPDLDFYTQDLYKGAAIALRDRNMYMPFRQELERPRADYVLEEPTRQLADINEKYNIGAQAMGAFAGPQSLAARLSNKTGMSDAANVFARVHGRNINTINTGLARQGQLDATYNALSAQRNDEEYDATQATLQMYDNEKNADMNDFMNWQADALTNAVGAYNLSSLYDQFNINPVSGGTIDFVNGRRPVPSKQSSPEALRQQRLKNMQDLYNQFGEKGLDAGLLKYYDQGLAGLQEPADNGNLMQTYGLTPEVLAAMSLANGQAKKGKEIKKFAVPFYTGKMGS